ncbi:DUF4124 domain-containing protein [Kangiella spongicola]|uniref:DUF4124 domain-containing protein n=1 Tax=Kangiella spongicola TaxID=796379 RepID=A0A318D6G5_9GAMM|nr:DUF4124 domain-containing protein [Kangiella spongicola]PXF64423.1 hypothetical protein DL796_04595 [Kangiella spongicola]
MRYLIGALFGVCLVLLVFGGMIYYDYYEKNHNLKVELKQPQLTEKTKTNYRNNHRSPLTNSKVRTQTRRAPVKQKPVLYTWKDKNGNKVISEHPPASGSYKRLVLPKNGLSVVEMDKAKSIKRKKRPRSQNISESSPANIKQRLIAKNTNSNCRWLVGRTYDLYTNIQRHKGGNRSIYCDEYYKRRKEMHKLAREGDACYYPHQSVSKCTKR